MDLPDLIQRLICDISGWTMPMQQASSAANGLLAVMANLGQAFSQAASASAATTGAVNQQAQALNNASSAAANFAKNWISGNQDVAAASGKAAATFVRNWINAAEETKKAIGSIPGFIRPGAPPMPTGQFERGATPAEFAQVMGRLPKDSTFAKEQAAAAEWTRFMQSSVQGGLRADQQRAQDQMKKQEQAAREAARATEHAMMQIKHAWMQFGRDLMSLTGHIAHGMAAFVEQNVPLVGGILAGAKRGGLMGWSVGGSLGSALGGTLGLGMGGPGGAIAGSMLGHVAGIGLGSISGAMIGGNVAALVEGITLAVNGLEKAFDMAARAAKNVFQSVVSLASEFQRIGVAFEVFTGSAEKGNKLFADMQQLAVQTPYNLRQMVDISQTLLAMGVPFEDVTKSMRMLGDVASGDADRLRRLTLAFSEVIAEGKITGQRVRQFAAAGLGVGDFAATMGIPISDFRKLMEDGQVPASVLVQTLERVTSAGGRFFMMSERQARTVAGAWSNLIDKLEIMGAKFGGALFQKFDVVGMLGRAGDFLGENAPAFLERMIPLLSAVKAAFTGMLEAVIPYWNQLIAVVENLIGKIDMTPMGLERIQAAFRSMSSNVLQFLGSVLILLAELAKHALGFLPGVSGNLQRAIDFSRAPVSTTLMGMAASSAAVPLSMLGGLGFGGGGGGEKTPAASITDVFDDSAKAIEKSINGFIATIERMTGVAGKGLPLPGTEAAVELEAGPLASLVNRLTGQKDWAINMDEMIQQLVPVSFMRGEVAGEMGGVGVKEALERKALSDPQGFLDQYRGAFPGAANFPIMARGAKATPSQLAGGAMSSLIRYMASGAEDAGPTQAPSLAQRFIRGVGGMDAAGWISQVDSWLQKKPLVVTVSEEAKKLVESIKESFGKGLTPIEQLARQTEQIRQVVQGPVDAAGRGPGALMEAMVAQKLMKGFMGDVPSPSATMIGSKEAGNIIANAQNNQGVKSIESALDAANELHKQNNDELKEIAAALTRREKAGKPLIPGDFGGG